MKTFVIGDVHGRRTQLKQLLAMLPRDAAHDTLVLLGDLIDRGADARGVVEACLALVGEAPARVVVLRGNHEQMLLDFLDGESEMWLHAGVGSRSTMESYGVSQKSIEACEREDSDEETLANLRAEVRARIPPAHIAFLRRTRFFYEDDCAIYVHAGLDRGRHPRDTSSAHLLWSRDADFFLHYTGKPCVFGHTPAPFLPLRGRVGRHGIYIFHSAIGIDSGYTRDLPLSCLELPSFTLRQAFADDHTTTHRITALIPPSLRQLHEEHCRSGGRSLNNTSHAKT
jgi:serine/threonine protein phosphatase 1